MLIGYDYQGVTMLNSKFTNNNFQRQMFGRHFSCFGEIKILETLEIFPFFFYVQIYRTNIQNTQWNWTVRSNKQFFN